MIALLLALLFVDPGQRNRFELTEIKVADGDTITARIALGWRVSIGPESIRASNYDAWESTRIRKTIGPITEEEIAKGKTAAKALEGLLGNGAVYCVPNGGGQRDAYGRILGELWVKRNGEWIDVAAWMKDQGHIRKDAKNAAEGSSSLENRHDSFGWRGRSRDGYIRHAKRF